VKAWEFPLPSIGAAAREIAHILRRERVGPAILAGNSYGGVVASQVARIMGRESLGLLMVDSVSPTIRAAVGELPITGKSRVDLSKAVVTTTVRRARSATASHRHAQLLAVSAWSASLHRSHRSIAVPVYLIATTDRQRRTGRDDLGWGDLAVGSKRVVSLDAEHGGLLVEPKVTEVSPLVAEGLDWLASHHR
jgi:thioesterase domain-containing protein